MKAILMSIQPEWCEKIFSGEKTIEVRKSAPKEVPFKVYMYCTIGGYIDKQRTIPKEPLFRETHFGGIKYTTSIDLVDKTLQEHNLANGKVVGDYVCERITEHEICDSGAVVNYWAEGLQHSCLTISQIDEYVGKRRSADYYKKSKISALHISAVKCYDEPKELSEFRKVCLNGKCSDCIYEECKITRPPQSWCYVEELQ